MCAFFNDGAARHDCDDVSRLDGGQPVSNDDAGSSFSGLIQSRLDRLQAHRGNILSEFCSSMLIHAQMCITTSYRKETHVTFSLSVSRAEVASSSNRILGFRTIARAIAMRCFSPLESCEPWAPTCVSYFLKRTEISRKGQNRAGHVSLTSTTQIEDIGFVGICSLNSHPAAS